MRRNKRILLIALAVLIVLIVITVIIFMTVNNKKQELEEEAINKEQLEMDFNGLFNNQENQYVKTLYNIEDAKSGKYNVAVKIPYIQINSEFDSKVNKEINSLFVNKMLEIMNDGEEYTILNIDYGTQINGNILSLAIRCELKQGRSVQRIIIKTYNYNIQEQKEINIIDVIPEGKEKDIQKQIDQEIEKQIKKEELIVQQGYGVYRRDKNSSIYKLENAKEFYIQDSVLYIIYSYGNNSYTNDVDLIINKI